MTEQFFPPPSFTFYQHEEKSFSFDVRVLRCCNVLRPTATSYQRGRPRVPKVRNGNRVNGWSRTNFPSNGSTVIASNAGSRNEEARSRNHEAFGRKGKIQDRRARTRERVAKGCARTARLRRTGSISPAAISTQPANSTSSACYQR